MTTTFDIAQDATATFAAYPWVLSDKGDGGGASETVVESDLDVKNGALWANNVCKALRQTNEVFQGTRFADKLGIGVVAGAAALRTTGGDVVLDTSDLYVSAGDIYVGSQLTVGATSQAFAGSALNVTGTGGQVAIYDVSTDATDKQGLIVGRPRTNSQGEYQVLGFLANASNNLLLIGGGLGPDGPTEIRLYTSTALNTAPTLRGSITSTGLLDWDGAAQFAGNVDFDSASPTFIIGTSGGSPTVVLAKADAGSTQLVFQQTVGIIGSKRLFHDTDETFKQQHFNGTTWDTLITLGANLMGFFNAAPVAQQGDIGELVDNINGTISDTLDAIPDPADTPITADALRDDLVANVLPQIRDALSSLAANIGSDSGGNSLRLALRNLGFMA